MWSRSIEVLNDEIQQCDISLDMRLVLTTKKKTWSGRTRWNLHSAKADDLFNASHRVGLDRSHGRVDLELALNNIDTDDDRASLVEHRHGFKHAGEDGQHL